MRVTTQFRDRVDAGRQLATRLGGLTGREVVVLALPRGGVPVAAEVARSLDAPLDIVLVRKLGVPSQPELAMGAIAEGGTRVVDEAMVRLARVTAAEVDAVETRERSELGRRARRYRESRPPAELAGRTVVVVDDGVATGATAKAACRAARARGARRVILAVPVAPPGWEARIGTDADELVALATPPDFRAVGQFYDDFSQVGDDDVTTILRQAHPRTGARVGRPAEPTTVRIAVDDVELVGELAIPERATGLVVFAHGSGSSRLSPRNRHVAAALRVHGLGTLLFDLLTGDEDRDRRATWGIERLARRLAGATDWLRRREEAERLPVGWFGASTGAAAALWAAAEPGADVGAIVSRGGRPDLAGPRLPRVAAPTLLIVGGADDVVLELNRRAYDALTCERRLTVVPGAGHLFEEPGTLDAAAAAAAEWFTDHLTG